jgi:sRNA-binding protein
VMRTALLLLASAAALAGCGLKGTLERPVPLWGNPPNEGPLDPRTIKAAEEKAAADKARQKAEADAQRAADAAAAEAATTPPAPAAAPQH